MKDRIIFIIMILIAIILIGLTIYVEGRLVNIKVCP